MDKHIFSTTDAEQRTKNAIHGTIKSVIETATQTKTSMTLPGEIANGLTVSKNLCDKYKSKSELFEKFPEVYQYGKARALKIMYDEKNALDIHVEFQHMIGPLMFGKDYKTSGKYTEKNPAFMGKFLAARNKRVSVPKDRDIPNYSMYLFEGKYFKNFPVFYRNEPVGVETEASTEEKEKILALTFDFLVLFWVGLLPHNNVQDDDPDVLIVGEAPAPDINSANAARDVVIAAHDIIVNAADRAASAAEARAARADKYVAEYSYEDEAYADAEDAAAKAVAARAAHNVAINRRTHEANAAFVYAANGGVVYLQDGIIQLEEFIDIYDGEVIDYGEPTVKKHRLSEFIELETSFNEQKSRDDVHTAKKFITEYRRNKIEQYRDLIVAFGDDLDNKKFMFKDSEILFREKTTYANDRKYETYSELSAFDIFVRLPLKLPTSIVRELVSIRAGEVFGTYTPAKLKTGLEVFGRGLAYAKEKIQPHLTLRNLGIAYGLVRFTYSVLDIHNAESWFSLINWDTATSILSTVLENDIGIMITGFLYQINAKETIYRPIKNKAYSIMESAIGGGSKLFGVMTNPKKFVTVLATTAILGCTVSFVAPYIIAIVMACNDYRILPEQSDTGFYDLFQSYLGSSSRAFGEMFMETAINTLGAFLEGINNKAMPYASSIVAPLFNMLSSMFTQNKAQNINQPQNLDGWVKWAFKSAFVILYNDPLQTLHDVLCYMIAPGLSLTAAHYLGWLKTFMGWFQVLGTWLLENARRLNSWRLSRRAVPNNRQVENEAQLAAQLAAQPANNPAVAQQVAQLAAQQAARPAAQPGAIPANNLPGGQDNQNLTPGQERYQIQQRMLAQRAQMARDNPVNLTAAQRAEHNEAVRLANRIIREADAGT